MFSMILEDQFEELDDVELIAVNGGACTGGGCTGPSYTPTTPSGNSNPVLTPNNNPGDCIKISNTPEDKKEPLASAPNGVAFPLGLEWNDKYVVTSGYGEREVLNTDAGDTSPNHYGLDISGSNIYGERINSIMDGTVTKVGNSNGFGNYVIVTHSNGTSTLYAHCSKVDITEGAAVSAGQKIAEVGSTGKSTGPHLHIAYDGNGDGKYDNPKYDNPEKLLYACN